MGPVIIDSTEQSTMASSWTEHLCLSSENGRSRIDVRGWKLVGEVGDFWNEETEDYDLPGEIDGADVVGVEDGWVVVAELELQSDTHPVYEFDRFSWNEFVSLFEPEYPFWCNGEVRTQIEAALLKWEKAPK